MRWRKTAVKDPGSEGPAVSWTFWEPFYFSVHLAGRSASNMSMTKQPRAWRPLYVMPQVKELQHSAYTMHLIFFSQNSSYTKPGDVRDGKTHSLSRMVITCHMPDDTNFSLSQSLRNSHQKKVSCLSQVQEIWIRPLQVICSSQCQY